MQRWKPCTLQGTLASWRVPVRLIHWRRTQPLAVKNLFQKLPQIAVLNLQLPCSKVFQGEVHCTNVLAQAYVRVGSHPHLQSFSTTSTLA